MEFSADPGLLDKVVARPAGEDFEIDFGMRVRTNYMHRATFLEPAKNPLAAHQGLRAEQAPGVDLMVRLHESFERGSPVFS